MRRTQRSYISRGILLPIAVAIGLSACQKWVGIEPPDLALQEQAEMSLDDRELLRLRFEENEASVEGTLQSLGLDSLVIKSGNDWVTVPRSTISDVAARRFDLLDTVLASICVLATLPFVFSQL